MTHDGPQQYNEEKILKFVSIVTYQVQTMSSMILCIETRAPISCIGNTSSERIVHAAYRKTIQFIHLNRIPS